MFTIKGVQSGKALNVASDLRVVMWTYSATDNQLWYWEKDSIRSKKYPEKVLILDIANFIAMAGQRYPYKPTIVETIKYGTLWRYGHMRLPTISLGRTSRQ